MLRLCPSSEETLWLTVTASCMAAGLTIQHNGGDFPSVCPHSQTSQFLFAMLGDLES